MIHIRRRNDLFEILGEKPPWKMGAILTALSTGEAELLGGFSKIPPSPLPGWIIVVTSKRGKAWNVVLTVHENPARITTWVVQRIPWEYWIGKTDRKPTVYDGDHPKKYEERKLEARKVNGYE